MNILNKTCQAMSPTPGAAAIPKRQKFSWAEPCSPGTFFLIPKADLNIDGSYQREEVSKAKVLDIARDWDWRLFGALSVILRKDDTFWVFDGGHRCRAAFLRDDIVELPCMVFEAYDEKAEARAFLGANTMKSMVSAYHKHRAAVKAGERQARAVQAILDKHGYTPILSGPRKYGFSAVGTLHNLVGEDARRADRVFAACAEIARDGEPITSQVLTGLFTCSKKVQSQADILSGDYIVKLKRETMDGIEAAIRREGHIVGKGGFLVGAKAILDLLNKGKRNRLTFD